MQKADKDHEELKAALLKMTTFAPEKEQLRLLKGVQDLIKLAKQRYSETVFEYPGDAVIYNKVAWFLAGGHSVADALHNTDTSVITDILRKDIAKRTGK